MKTIRFAVLIGLAALLVNADPVHVAAGEMHAPLGAEPAGDGRAITGTVVSTTNVASYTYVEVDTGDGIVWAAGPRTEVKVGDRVFVPDGSPMPDFYSPTLDRRFAMIYFATAIKVHGEGPSTAPTGGDATAGEPDLTSIERAEGGMTVGELHEQKADLGGKEVVLRGKVVKYNAGIMGKTWIHVRDGTSGPEGANDVTVTTSSTDASLGDIVLVRGVVALDKDFGYGYQYDLLIEDATVTNE